MSSAPNPIFCQAQYFIYKKQNPNEVSLNQIGSAASRIVLVLLEMLSEHYMNAWVKEWMNEESDSTSMERIWPKKKKKIVFTCC